MQNIGFGIWKLSHGQTVQVIRKISATGYRNCVLEGFNLAFVQDGRMR